MPCKITLAGLLFLTSLLPSIAQSLNSSQAPFIKGEILIVVKDTGQSTGIKSLTVKKDPVFNAIDKKIKIDRIEQIGSKNKNSRGLKASNNSSNIIFKLKFKNKDIDIVRTISELKSISEIEKIEPNYIFKSFVTIPDEYSDRERLAGSQWALGQINAPEGWDRETGDSNIVITILDSGVDWNHPDLKTNIWKNAHEIPGNNIDDDENGYIDDIIGWDFVSTSPDQVAVGEDAEPADNNPMDFNGHGTHVAGIAGAVGNNHLGIAGLAWNCKIMPVRAGYNKPDGIVSFSYSDIIAGIYYAVDNGTDIINMSFGESLIGVPEPQSEIFTILKDAIVYAYNHNVVLVAAAGNDPISGLNTYPAAFDEVISVAASTYNNQKANFSAFNSDWIDVAAPGTDILSTFYYYGYTYEDGAYTHLNGTSMSAPHVSGLAALIKSQNEQFTNSEIATKIKNESDIPKSDLFIGWGVINVQKALNVNTPSGCIAEISSPGYNGVHIFDTINITGVIHGDRYKLEYGQGIYPVTWNLIDSGRQDLNGLITSWDVSDIPSETYTLKLSVTGSNGTIYDRTTFQKKTPAFPFLKGWPVQTGEEIHSSAVVADLDADHGNEIIVYGSDGYLYVFNSDGTNKPGWPKFLGRSRSELGDMGPKQNWVMGTPAIADLDNDGDNDIITGSLDGNIYALNAKGENLTHFPVYLGDRICSSPSIFDLNGDGIPEIICRSENYLNVLDVMGRKMVGWPRTLSSNGLIIWSNQAIGDLDNDGDYEIVVGSEYYNTTENRNNKLYAYHHNGAMVTGWPVDLNPTGEFTGWVLSSPAIGDLDRNGTCEIVVGSDDNRLWVLNGDGTNFSNAWPKILPFGFRSSPAIADLDSDGDLEIVIGHRSDLYPSLRLYAMHHTGEIINNWPYLADGMGGFTFGWISPVIGDMNNNDTLDIISIKEVGSYLGTGGGDICAIAPDARLLDGYPLGLEEVSYNSVTISDVDSDQDIELIAGDLSGQVYIWDLPYHYNKEKIPWGQFRHDNWNTGLYDFNPVPPRPLCDDLTVCEGESIPYLNASGENVKWYADADLTQLIFEGNNYLPGNHEVGPNCYFITQTVNGQKSRATKMTLTVSPLPATPRGYAVNKCDDQMNADLSASGENIRWYDDSELTNLIHAGNLFATPTTPGAYKFYITQTINNCESEADTIALTVNPVPEVPLSNNYTVCEGTSDFTLEAAGQNITWYSDSTRFHIMDTGNSYHLNKIEPGFYAFYITQNIAGCESENAIIGLTVNPLPSVSLGNDTTIKQNQDILLGPYDDHYRFVWYNGSTRPSLIFSGRNNDPGNHQVFVTVTDTNHCTFTDSVTIEVAECKITETLRWEACDSYISPSGKYKWTSSGEYYDTLITATGCDSILAITLTIITLDNSVSENNGILVSNASGADYQWLNCDNSLPLEGENLQAFTAKTNGNYSVVISRGECADTSSCIAVIVTEDENGLLNKNMTLYPNPNRGDFTIDLGRIYSTAEISVCETDGRVIRKDKVFNTQRIDMQISGTPGIYLIFINTIDGTGVFKVLKE